MKPATYNHVLQMRHRNDLWTEACLLEDREDRVSHRKVFRLLRGSVALGNRDARGSLARAYDAGNGVRQSRRMAMHLDRKAWRSGSSLAARNIGVTLKLEGRISSAVSWFSKAISMGDPDARLDLAKILMNTPDSRAEASRLLRDYIAAGSQQIVSLIPGKPPENAEDEGFEEAKRLLEQMESERA